MTTLVIRQIEEEESMAPCLRSGCSTVLRFKLRQFFFFHFLNLNLGFSLCFHFNAIDILHHLMLNLITKCFFHQFFVKLLSVYLLFGRIGELVRRRTFVAHE